MVLDAQPLAEGSVEEGGRDLAPRIPSFKREDDLVKTLLSVLAVKLAEIAGLAVLVGMLSYFSPAPPYVLVPAKESLSPFEAALGGVGFSLMFNLFSGYPIVSGVFLGLIVNSTDTNRQLALLGAGMALAYTGAWLLLLFVPNPDQLHFTVPIGWALFGLMSFWLTLSLLKPHARTTTPADRAE